MHLAVPRVTPHSVSEVDTLLYMWVQNGAPLPSQPGPGGGAMTVCGYRAVPATCHRACPCPLTQ